MFHFIMKIKVHSIRVIHKRINYKNNILILILCSRIALQVFNVWSTLKTHPINRYDNKGVENAKIWQCLESSFSAKTSACIVITLINIVSLNSITRLLLLLSGKGIGY